MLEGQKILEDRYKANNKKGKTEVYKGKPKRWEVLDESFEPELRREVQRNVFDGKYLTGLGGEGRKEMEFVSDEEEEFIQHPIKSKYLD